MQFSWPLNSDVHLVERRLGVLNIIEVRVTGSAQEARRVLAAAGKPVNRLQQKLGSASSHSHLFTSCVHSVCVLVYQTCGF